MNPERWQKVESIFHKALDADESRRASVIEESCAGDEALRREVESLLAHHSDSASFMEQPAFADQAPPNSVRPVAAADAPRPDLRGLAVGHYRILEEIGSGGMGVVYKAEDTRLGRLVALKFLPEHMAADSVALERFRREARSASALNHPNICTIYDIDSQGAREFIVMEYLDGLTLATYVAGLRAVGTELVAKLGIPIAEALSAAHSKGVIHRDIKPGNIFVTQSGLVKVLDFGLAKLVAEVRQSDGAPLTETHAITGTLPYMSPEQLRGENLDTRSDIYALGVVLYEIATGQRLYSSSLQARLVDEILNRPAAPPSSINRKLPAKADDIILKCLAKDPEDRYQTAKEVAVDLRRLSIQATSAAASHGKNVWILAFGGAALLMSVLAFNVAGIRNRVFALGVSPVRSIAVLPLENLSRDPEQEYFADGITEQLTTELAQISSLKVISHTSVVQFKGTKKSLPQIAKELGVDAVVEGAVQRSGEKVGITVQLVQAPTDRHLWARSYQRDLRDVLDLEREVTHAIADEIKAKVTATEKERLASARPVNREAYEDYLKGWYFFDKRTAQAATLSVSYFRKSIEQDPRFPPAYAGLAEALQTLNAMDVAPYSETQSEASQALRHALELDPALGEAHAALGLGEAQWNWNWVEAERQMKMGLQFSPGSAIVHNRYSRYLQAVGRLDEGVQEARRAAELDPLSFFMHRELGRSFYFAREYDDAIAELGRAAELDQHADVVNNWLSWIAEKKGDHERAMELWLRNAPLSGDPENVTVSFRKAYEDRDWRRFWEADLRYLRQRQNLPSAPYFIAADELRLGNKDAAFEWLGKSLEAKSVWVTWIKVDPLFDDLHTDPRFKDLLRRVGLPQ